MHTGAGIGGRGCWCPEDGAERVQEAPTEGLVGKWPSEPQGEPAIVSRRVWPGWDSETGHHGDHARPSVSGEKHAWRPRARWVDGSQPAGGQLAPAT